MTDDRERTFTGPEGTRPGGRWILGGAVGYGPDDERGKRTLEERRDMETVCGWECDEIEERSCPAMGVPCKASWDRYENPRREVVATWGFVESWLGLFGSVPKTKLLGTDDERL